MKNKHLTKCSRSLNYTVNIKRGIVLLAFPVMLMASQPAHAAVALGYATVSVALKILGAAFDLIQNGKPQKVATVALVDGSHGQVKDVDSDSGFFYADSESAAANGNGIAHAEGHASAFLLGLAGVTKSIGVGPIAAVKPIETVNEAHSHFAYAKVQVESRGLFAPLIPLPNVADAKQMELAAQSNWGDISAELDFYASLQAGASGAGASSSLWSFGTMFEGQSLFGGTALLNSKGELTLSGDLTPAMFNVAYDHNAEVWTAETNQSTLTFQVGHYDVASARALGLTTFTVDVMNELSPQAQISAVPEPETLALFAAGLGVMGLARRKHWLK